MATVNDIDTKSFVNKYLSRQVVTPAANQDADSSEEIQGILESIAISMLLFPQTALSMALRAKNTLQQTITFDLQLLSFISDAIQEFNNPDGPITDTSALANAQTALINLDKLGKVSTNLQAYTQYQASISSFLNSQLATFVKRNSKNAFERSGTEAKADVNTALSAFSQAHTAVASQIASLAQAITNFQSVDLTAIVSQSTITRVRSSLIQITNGIQANNLSKMITAVELLSGAAALQLLTNKKGILDPEVQTGVFPSGRIITADSGVIEASSFSANGPFNLAAVGTPWNFSLTTDPLDIPKSYTLEIPASSASGRAYVTTALAGATSTYNIPAGYKLYLRLIGLGSPFIAIPITTGSARTIAQICTDINAVLVADGTAAPFGTNQIIIFGSSSVTSIIVLPDGIGTISVGVYTPPAPSANRILGFGDLQTSLPIGSFTAQSLFESLSPRIPTASLLVNGSQLEIESNDSGPKSSLSFSGISVTSFGFANSVVGSLPPGLLLKEKGQTVDPSTLGIFIGSQVTLTETLSSPRKFLNEPVTAINPDGTLVFGTTSVPRGLGLPVTIISPIVGIIQKLANQLSTFVGTLDQDFSTLQRFLIPLFGVVGTANLAQQNDANKQISVITNKLNVILALLTPITVRDDQTQFGELASTILNTLDERSLTTASDLLRSCNFSGFFALSKDSASPSSSLLSAIESIGTNDLPTATTEDSLQEGNTVLGSNPDQNLLPGAEPSSSP